MQSRRQFISILFAGVTVMVTGCGKEESSDNVPTSGPVKTSKIGDVASNHGHRAVITSEQLTAGNGINLSIQAGADHTHTLALTSSEVTNIRRGVKVAKTTASTNGHSHMVTFNPGAV